MTENELTAHYIAQSLELLGYSEEAIDALPPHIALSCIASGIDHLRTKAKVFEITITHLHRVRSKDLLAHAQQLRDQQTTTKEQS
jgi:hypothetical protein